jgi:hypothetical protein
MTCSAEDDRLVLVPGHVAGDFDFVPVLSELQEGVQKKLALANAASSLSANLRLARVLGRWRSWLVECASIIDDHLR